MHLIMLIMKYLSSLPLPYIYIWGERQTDRQTDSDRDTGRDSETERHRHTDRQIETE